MSTQSTSSVLVLVLEQPGQAAQEVYLQHGLTIGRDPSNTLVIDHPGVERIHARVIHQDPNALILQGEQAGRFQTDRGQAVSRVTLAPGTTVCIGPARITCRLRATRPTVVLTDNSWKVTCPRCQEPLVDQPHGQCECPACGLGLMYIHDTSDQGFEGWLPQQVGPYKIRKYVGAGGIGIVLWGAHEETDELAAVKLLREGSRNSPWRHRFRQEIVALMQVTHRNLVRLQDYGEDQDLVWLAMDWVEGQTLAQILEESRQGRRGQMLSQVADWLSQIVQGLTYLHEMGTIHRDVKPQNILIDKDGLVRLCDMGIAKLPRGQTRISTQTGTMVGTIGYMSPEQAQAKAVTAASDVYSLGVVWYEILMGKRPQGLNLVPDELAADCPTTWANCIADCLALSPDQRPSLQAIQVVLTGISVVTRGPTERIKGILWAVAQPFGRWTLRAVRFPFGRTAAAVRARLQEHPRQAAAWLAIVCFLAICVIATQEKARLRIQSAFGSKTAMVRLGEMCADSAGTKNAAYWFDKASRAGNAEGMLRLGDLYDRGQGGLAQSDTNAVWWYEQSHKAGNVEATYRLGLMKATNRAGTQDDHDAVRLFRKAALQGNARAMFWLGYMIEAGRGGLGHNASVAADWYGRAAAGGDLEAMRCLANKLADGCEGLAKDRALAFEWYCKAAAAGDIESMWRVAVAYSEGLGVSRDDAKAFTWCEKAARAGFARAMCDLGSMYANGRGTRRDDTEAFRCYCKAANAGERWAIWRLGLMYEEGSGTDRNDANAAWWYRQSANAGNADGMWRLGVMYEGGRGVPKSDQEAGKWYRKAADTGSAEGLRRYQEARKIPAMDRVLATNKRVYEDCKAALESDPSKVGWGKLDAAWGDYKNRIDAIDLSGCPGDFADAFGRFREAVGGFREEININANWSRWWTEAGGTRDRIRAWERQRKQALEDMDTIRRSYSPK